MTSNSDREFIRSGGVNHVLPRQLLEELLEAEACLVRSGFKRSADQRTWVPPANDTAAKYYRILPVFKALLRIYAHQYVPWTDAGGPNECPHGRAEGIPCNACDVIVVNYYVRKVNEDGKKKEA